MVYITTVLEKQVQGEGGMGSADDCGYVKQGVAGPLGLLIMQDAVSAESKFLSLVKEYETQ